MKQSFFMYSENLQKELAKSDKIVYNVKKDFKRGKNEKGNIKRFMFFC